ncbi:hypothetical protein SNEBB_007034 [Seison nebaliae]|nr:hypothetical protein SNEBB_007034 [Seison nebaliae]
MSIQWTFAAYFLYTEIIVVFILLLPFISATRWSKLFQSNFAKNVNRSIDFFFKVVIVAFFVLFADAVREIWKYNGLSMSADKQQQANLKLVQEIDTTLHLKLFRAQRNLYISGFALYLWFVIRRVTQLLIDNSKMQARYDAMEKQANQATKAAEAYLDQSDMSDVVKAKVEEIESLKELLEKKDIDIDTLKKQAKGVAEEFDRIIDKTEFGDGNKKDD